MIPVWSTACPDWAERLKKGLSIIPAPIYPDQAAHALAIFKQLRIVDAPGSPTFGESCAQWVFDLVAALFGSYDAQTGVRHIKEVFILIPKKNSKSTLAAGIMMTALLLNWRQAAGYTILAPTVEVAANAFNPARDMVRRDDDLDDLCQVQTHIRTITHRVTAEIVCSVFRVPAYKIGVGQPPSSDNVEALEQQYYSQCLQTLIESIELLLDEALETGENESTEFDVTTLLRMDSERRMKTLGESVKNTLLTPNEARKRENLPPLAGGDALYLQQQNYSL
ncbi:terminase large subunit domain-containing protein, partial [Escherichia coli]